MEPAGVGKDALHGVLRTENQEIDHVAGVARFVANAAGNFGEEFVVDAREGIDLLGDGLRGTEGRIGGKDVDVNIVGAVAGVGCGLIYAKAEATGDWRDGIVSGAEQKWLRSVGVS